MDIIEKVVQSNVAASLLLSPPEETVGMLRITTENKRGKMTLSVEGRVAGQWVAALEQCWRELYATSPRQKFSVNLCAVSFIDDAGKVLLKDMHRLGVELIAEGCLNQAIINEITRSNKKGESERDKRVGSRKGPIIF